MLWALALLLTGCYSPQATPAESASAQQGPRCLSGKWSVDVGMFARNAYLLTPQYTKGKGSGSITVAFTGPQMSIGYAFAGEFPQPTPNTSWRISVTGLSTAAYTATATQIATASPHFGARAVQSVVVGGSVTSQKVVTKLNQPILDFVDGPVAYTCTSTTLTLANEAGFVWTAARQT